MIKLFIQNLASFDFAFLAKSRGPIGRSFYVDVIFEGKLNKKGMIIDFSQAKKLVKSVIEDIDHKLFVSQTNVKHETNSHIIVTNISKFSKSSIDKANEKINFFAMHAKRSWVKIMPSRVIQSLEEDKVSELENLIAKIILQAVPKNISKITVQLSERQSTLSNHFHYTHSLCHHAGNCQRFHGHSAQLQIFLNQKFISTLSNELAQKIKGLYIISKRHVCPLFNSAYLEKIKEYCFPKKSFEKMQNELNAFEYKGSDGRVSIIISKHLSLILPNEGTIENITQYIYKQIPDSNGIEVHVYEGLSKGAVIA